MKNMETKVRSFQIEKTAYAWKILVYGAYCMKMYEH